MTRANPPLVDSALRSAQFEAAAEIGRLRELSENFAAASPELVTEILTQAARFASGRLDSLNASEHDGAPRLVNGRVELSAAHRQTWEEFAGGGWIALDLPGRGRRPGASLILSLAVQEIFDRSCPAFGMLAVSSRSAAKLISAWAEEPVRALWLPKLSSGEWSATICISEVEAGSDVSRIRTTAVKADDGAWRITGEKQWISFGDHDLGDMIGHCLLARTAGAKGLSLFLVPDRVDGERNGVVTRRIEEKMGLHLSPTCALGFENSRGVLLGEEGRGLAQMFVMIMNMRMSVGTMGLAIASGAADVALAYARERKQGGAPQPVAIIEHADVKRQVLSLHARVELLRGLIYSAAVFADLAKVETDPASAADFGAVTQWLLPIVKTGGSEAACYDSSDAMQVLGGARLYPGMAGGAVAERCAGVADLRGHHRHAGDRPGSSPAVERQWRGPEGVRAFRAPRHPGAWRPGRGRGAGGAVLLESVVGKYFEWRDRPVEAEAGANAFLELATVAALAWIASRLGALTADDPASGRLRSLALYWLDGVGARAAAVAAAATVGASGLAAVLAL